jgi:hypothetical protein
LLVNPVGLLLDLQAGGANDVGKFSKPFQIKRPDLYPAELGEIDGVPSEPHHDAAGLILWREALSEELLKAMPQGLDLLPLARAVYGHHGSPAREDSPLRLQALYGRAGLTARSRRTAAP